MRPGKETTILTLPFTPAIRVGAVVMSGAAAAALLGASLLSGTAAARADAPQINGPATVGIRPGTPFLWSIPATGTHPLKYQVSGLPAGLALSPTGILTGKIPAAGDYAVKVTVQNSAGKAVKTVHLVAGSAVALTPPLGWNSYDAYGGNVNEAQVLDNARYLRENMQPYGWDTVVVDFRWYDPASATSRDAGDPGEVLAMDGFGRLLPAPNRFPSAAQVPGFQRLGAQVHSLGLKFGIHIMRGIPRNAVAQNLPIAGSPYHAADAADQNNNCPWCPDMFGVKGGEPAGQAYYDSLFRLYASWGVDYVKMDDASRAPYHADEIEAVQRAIDKCGRSIVFSLSPGETPIAQGAHVAAHANLWRVSDDFWDGWPALEKEFGYGAAWQPFAGPGHWADADMLPVGHISLNGRPSGPDRQTRFTPDEQRTLLSLWCLLPSPLMVGANLPDNTPATLALLTNPEVLAVDQDSLGAAAGPASQNAGLEVWSRPLADGSTAVGLFNRTGASASVSADWSALKLSGSYTVRDLWARKDKGAFATRYSAAVPSHGAVLLRLTKVP